MGKSLGVTTGPKQIIKSTKSKFATPLKWENWQRVRSGSLALQNNTNIDQKTRHQQTQKPKKQKTKNKKHTHKKQDCTPPRGGVVAESWVLSFCCVFFCFFGFLFFFVVFCFFCFWFLVLFSHCRKRNRNYRNCQWLQSSERTMAHVQCQWFENAVKTRTPRVSPSEKNMYW